MRIAPGTGQIEINHRPLNDYLTAERDRKALFGPLEVTSTGGKLDIFVNATGGGSTGQAGAIVMGLGRALAKYDRNPRSRPPQRGLHDPRQPNEGTQKIRPARGARRRFQFSKR